MGIEQAGTDEVLSLVLSDVRELTECMILGSEFQSFILANGNASDCLGLFLIECVHFCEVVIAMQTTLIDGCY